MNKMKTQGFTIIELIVCIMIIGLLAMMAHKGYAEYNRFTYENRAKQEILKMTTEIQEYFLKQSSYTKMKEADVSKVINRKNLIDGQLVPYYTVKAYVINSGSLLSTMSGDQIVTDVVIVATPQDAIKGQGYYGYLATLSGYKCKNATSTNIGKLNCGTGSEQW